MGRLLHKRKRSTLPEFPMSFRRLPVIAAPLISLALLLLLQSGHNAVSSPGANPRAYIERGDQVEKRYASYSKRLSNYHAALISAVKEHAPDLLVYLQPREPLLYGYQVLPQIVLDGSAANIAHVGAVAYSWPWTDRLLDAEEEEITESEAELKRAAHAVIERRAILEKLSHDYAQHSRRLRNIYDHIQYNRLWQAAIASDRARYDRETALLGQVVERQSISRRLDRAHSGLRTASIDAPLGISELTNGLKKRHAVLSQEINQAIDQMHSPAFIKLENAGRERIFHVPLFTDIENAGYISSVKEIIENTWQLKDGKNSFRIQLHITHIPVEALYVDQRKPSAGQKIDIKAHLRRFPPGGAILTTGARTTHVRTSAIVLGPHPVAPQVLAHEFGHILGFRDRYVRGYKDLGEHGLQVVEAVADPGDIMSAAPQGVVQRSHFLQLLDARSRSRDGVDRRLISGK